MRMLCSAFLLARGVDEFDELLGDIDRNTSSHRKDIVEPVRDIYSVNSVVVWRAIADSGRSMRVIAGDV